MEVLLHVPLQISFELDDPTSNIVSEGELLPTCVALVMLKITPNVRKCVC